jgi:hypothetical protein
MSERMEIVEQVARKSMLSFGTLAAQVWFCKSPFLISSYSGGQNQRVGRPSQAPRNVQNVDWF